ncbi:MAG: N-acetylornithine carbamoyltransferase [Bacteroidota bacterium]|jgi:N-succinyl-L-ornithine transcarbamylase
MKHFFSVEDVQNLPELLKKALEIKQNPLADLHYGKNKTLGLIFFNPSLRTRMSSQKAAYNLGMNVITMNVGSDGWQLETEEGAIMNGGKAEHIKEAAMVMSAYCDVIGIRCFAGLENKAEDDAEKVLMGFMKYSTVPVINLESSTLHPLQSFADLITIESFKKVQKPKVVLTWAPHPKALPQAVPNSFAQWMNATDYDFVITHPKGYELDKKFAQNAPIEYNQDKALEGADFVYVKNWSALEPYGKILSQDLSWTISDEKMALTNNGKFMHCLPVRRNMIVNDSVIDGENALHIHQAANRVVSMQTILKQLI